MRLIRSVSLLSLLLFLAVSARAQAPFHELEPASAEEFSRFGGAVAGVLDVNGDGLGDLLVGDTRGGPQYPHGQAGIAYLYDGATGALLLELISPQAQEGGAFGSAVAGVPDADGDGLGDLLIGASGEDGDRWRHAGRAYLFSGADGTLLHAFDSPNESGSGGFGGSVSGVSDADGDGFGDLLIGANKEYVLLSDGSTRNAGRAYLFSGATGALIHEWVSPNAAVSGEFGLSVSGVADADGDGRGDLLIGARDENPGGVSYGNGRAYLFSGATGELVYELVSPNEQRRGYFGGSVSGVPDANGDGRGDLLVGAAEEDVGGGLEEAGRAYLFSGATGELLYELVSPLAERIGEFGFSVSGVPDVDGDGRGDLVVGAHRERTSGSRSPVGRVYVFSGADGTPVGAVVSPIEHDYGPYYSPGFARSVAGVPDVEGDGSGDVLVGATGEGPFGRAYLFEVVPRLPAVELTLVAQTPVAIVDEGTFSFTTLLRNTTDEVQTVDVWAELEHEKGGPLFDPVFGPMTVTVGPGERLERTFVQEVPEGTVPGDYTYRGLTGQFPQAAEDSDDFPGFVNAIEGERFYPLGLGDTWTYEVGRGYCEYFTWDCHPIFNGYLQRTVVKDTLIDGRSWSVAEVERRTLDQEVVDASRCAVRIAPDGRVMGRTISGTCDTIERTLQKQDGTWNLRYSDGPDVAPAVVEIGEASYQLDGTRRFQIEMDYRERYPKASIRTAADLGIVSYGMDSGGWSFYRTGKLIYAQVGGVTYSGEHAFGEGNATAEADFALSAAYPNPFRSATTLGFSTSEASHVRLTVYDVLGREVASLIDERRDAGAYSVRFDGAGLPSGVYLVRLEAEGQVQTQRLTLVR